MFINVTTRQQISLYSIAPTDICLLVPHIWKSGGILFLYPHLKIRGTAHASIASIFFSLF